MLKGPICGRIENKRFQFGLKGKESEVRKNFRLGNDEGLEIFHQGKKIWESPGRQRHSLMIFYELFTNILVKDKLP